MSNQTIPIPRPDTGPIYICNDFAPSSSDFTKLLLENWGTSYTVLYYFYPMTIFLYSFVLFVESFSKVHKGAQSKHIEASLFWILSLFPVQQLCNVLAIYMPSVMPYANFIATIWLAYALHQTYNLFRNLAGGTKHFLNFTNQFEVRANARDEKVK